MRQVSPGRQRASVERDRSRSRLGNISIGKPKLGSDSGGRGSGGRGSGGSGSGGSGSGGSGSGGHGPGEPRTYPGMALGLMLVAGVLLGLLFAAVISSFVDGDSSSSSAKPSPSTRASGSSDGSSSSGDESRSAAEGEGATSPEARDVRIMGCGTDARGYASASVLITNSTQERKTYYVRVLFTAPGEGRIVSDDVASAKHVPPGTSAPLQTVQAVDAAPGERIQCRLASVTRF